MVPHHALFPRGETGRDSFPSGYVLAVAWEGESVAGVPCRILPEGHTGTFRAYGPGERLVHGWPPSCLRVPMALALAQVW